jgi:deoxyribose-phosphate aldolase
MFNKELAKKIDHTILKPDCTFTDIKKLCDEAKTYSFASVCVPPYYVKEAFKQLEDSLTKVTTVIGFPMGYSTTPAKVEEVKRAIVEGVDELDVVVNICAIKEGNWSYVRNDIDSMTRAAHLRGKVVKIILEVGLLTNSEIEQVCKLCNEIEVNYIKTSTGYHTTPITTESVKFLKSRINPKIKLKASGGITTQKQAEDLLAAGADRLGASASLEIIKL